MAILVVWTIVRQSRRDPGIGNSTIPNPGIENSSPGLQSLITDTCLHCIRAHTALEALRNAVCGCFTYLMQCKDMSLSLSICSLLAVSHHVTCSTVVLQCYRRQAVRARQNSTLRNFVLPGPIVTKLGTIGYVGDPYPYANFSKILHYESRFSLKTRINLVVSATKIRSQIGISPCGFQILG